MTEKQDQDRTETARRHDDRDLIENLEPAPSGGGTSGGRLAQEIGTRDEERAVGGAHGVTRVEGDDKVQPRPATRADNEGANG